MTKAETQEALEMAIAANEEVRRGVVEAERKLSDIQDRLDELVEGVQRWADNKISRAEWTIDDEFLLRFLTWENPYDSD